MRVCICLCVCVSMGVRMWVGGCGSVGVRECVCVSGCVCRSCNTGLDARKSEPGFDGCPLKWNTRPPRPLKVIYLLIVNQNLKLTTSLVEPYLSPLSKKF